MREEKGLKSSIGKYKAICTAFFYYFSIQYSTSFNMKKHLYFRITTIALLLFVNTIFSQTVNLGILESFEGYTGAGAITNGGTWTGDAGTNVGAFSGFPASGPTFTGNTYTADATTVQCRFDLFRTYIHINALFVDHLGHLPAFGLPGGETITPGVYYVAGAGSVGGKLILDGQNQPNPFFVIKYFGAMTVGESAEVLLINGAKSSNVFFCC